jgi:hypothetical protein
MFWGLVEQLFTEHLFEMRTAGFSEPQASYSGQHDGSGPDNSPCALTSHICVSIYIYLYVDIDIDRCRECEWYLWG